MSINPGGYPTLVGGAVLVLLAAWLLYVDGRRRATMAFALYLLVLGLNGAFSVFAYASDLAPDLRLMLSRVNITFYFARPFLLALFLLQFPHPRRIFGSTRSGTAAVIALLFVVEILYWIAPTLHRTESFAADGRMILNAQGPLAVLGGAVFLVLGFGALILGRESLQSPARPRSSLLLVSLALGIVALYSVADYISWGLLDPERLVVQEPWRIAEWFVRVSTVFMLFPLLALVGRHARRNADEQVRRQCRVYLWTAASVAILAVGTYVAAPQSFGTTMNPTRRFIDGLVVLGSTGLVIYALLRHRFLGIDVKVKWTLKQSTVAAVFIGLFFVVSESAATFFSDRIGTYLGIAAAGLLVFAFAPLQQFAQHVADRAMPGVKSVGEMTEDERLSLYRGQAVQAWADGAIDRNERALLNKLREGLGIPRETAARIEDEAAAEEVQSGV